jgi:hypothetical protein
MSSVIIKLTALAAGEVAADKVRAYHPDIEGAWTLAVEESLANAEKIIVNPADDTELIWTDDLIDDTKDLQLATVSLSGVVRMDGIPPVPAKVAADLTTLYLAAKDLTMVADNGVKLKAQLVGENIVLGGALISRETKEFSTSSGAISFTVGRGAKVRIDFPAFGKKTIDTTGLDSVNLATAVSL